MFAGLLQTPFVLSTRACARVSTISFHTERAALLIVLQYPVREGVGHYPLVLFREWMGYNLPEFQEKRSTTWGIHKFCFRKFCLNLYPLGICGIFSWMIRLSKFNNFLLNTFPEHFCTICLRFEICEIFGRSFCFSRIRGACMVCVTISLSVVSDWLPSAFISDLGYKWFILRYSAFIWSVLHWLIRSNCQGVGQVLSPPGGGGKTLHKKELGCSWEIVN